ncbi:MAG: PAS domain S-box protein [Desulfobacteraceae bacterium]|nr:PAS domain S-box protein [Desulfobacteraceae bacterium]
MPLEKDIFWGRTAETAANRDGVDYRELVESASSIILRVDITGCLSFINEYALDFFGYSARELLGKNVVGKIVPGMEMTGRTLADWIEQIGLRPESYSKSLSETTLRSGRKVWIAWTNRVVRNAEGAIAGLFYIGTDITNWKRAERALEESQLRLHGIIQGLPVPSFVLDQQHKVLSWNKAIEGLSGFEDWRMVGGSDHWKGFYRESRPTLADLVVDSESDEAFQHWYPGCRKVASQEGYEVTEYCPDVGGEGKTLRITAVPLRDSRGELIGAIQTLVDETENKRNKQALIAANQQLNDIIEFLPDATFVLDEKGKVIAWNRAIEEMTGVPKDEMLGRGDGASSVPFYGEKHAHLVNLLDFPDNESDARYGKVRRKGRTLYAETFAPLVHENKGAHVLASAAPLIDVQGKRVGSIESIRDITEAVRQGGALRESQQLLLNIIDFLPDATFVIDTEGKVIAWNRAIEEMTGIKASEVLGKGDYEYALPFYGERRPILIDMVSRPPDDMETRYAKTERKGAVLSGEAYMPVLRGGGTYLFGKASILKDSRGNVIGAIESIRDMSERRRMEEALTQAEHKFRGIFENAVLGIFQMSPEGKLLSANPAYARLLGYETPEELVGSELKIRDIFVQQDRLTELMRLIESARTVKEFEIQFYRKNRSIGWANINVLSVRDKEGKIVSIEGNAEDITRRKALESQLLQSQKMEAMGTLAGGIAHDFNNILSPIIGYSELSLQFISPASPLHHNMEQVVLAANRAKTLVKQILTFSRKTEQILMPVEVGIIAKEAVNLLRSSLPATIDMSYRSHANASRALVLSDPSQIHQIFMNLATNSAHAMSEEGGRLQIDLNITRITSASSAEFPELDLGEYLEIIVADTGHGMNEAVRARIFDPYFTTKGHEGTGLGLAMVYGIVKSLRGAISVVSEENAGTTFRILLPICQTPSTTSLFSQATLPTGVGNILVVDDEKVMVELLQSMLKQLGYNVTARCSSQEALEAIKAHPGRFQLLITDQTMPQMTGSELAREIFKIRKDFPIVLCTGFSEKIDECGARALGISGFLMKPVGYRDLAVVVQKALGLVGFVENVN